MKDSEARKHYLSMKADSLPAVRRPLGFEVPKPVEADFFKQPYGLPKSHWEQS